MPPAGFETAVPPSDQPQNPALDRSSTGIGETVLHTEIFIEAIFFPPPPKKKHQKITWSNDNSLFNRMGVWLAEIFSEQPLYGATWLNRTYSAQLEWMQLVAFVEKFSKAESLRKKPRHSNK
jgi:hypothetical protein